MKKKMLLGLLVVIPFLTACGNDDEEARRASKMIKSKKINSMRCEYSSDKEIQGYLFVFNDDDKLIRMGLYEGVDINNLSDDDLCTDKESCIKLAKSNISECENDSDMESCRVESDDKSVILIGDYKESALKDNKDYDRGMTKSEVKKQAESEGFTCR